MCNLFYRITRVIQAANNTSHYSLNIYKFDNQTSTHKYKFVTKYCNSNFFSLSKYYLKFATHKEIAITKFMPNLRGFL